MTTPMNGIYVLQGVNPAQIAAAPVGVKVVEIYDDNNQLLSASQVTEMKSGGGSVLGYFSIGEAENYRSYFSSLPASTLGPVDPSWPGDYQVAYWTPAWKTVATNYIDQMIAQGYQGAYFDVVDECETAWAKANAPGGDPIGAMVSLVQSLAAYAHAQDPAFKIWVNASGAEDLLANPAFVNAIDGAFEEELFYKDNGSPQSSADVNYNLGLLNNLTAAGKPVVAIEYVTGAATVADVQAKAAAAGIGSYIANPNLGLQGVDTEGFATLPPQGPPPPPPPPTTDPGTSSGTPPIVVDLTAVHATPPGADLGKGDSATITLTLSKPIDVSGAPTLSLNDGGTATYLSGSGTDTLTFTYKVGAGENTSQLAVTGVVVPSGAALADLTGTPATISGGGPVAESLIVDTSRTRTAVGIGTGQTVRAGHGNDIVTLSGGNATLVFRGNNNVAFLGGGSGPVNATIKDSSRGLTVDVLTGGVDQIIGFGSDKHAVVHLLGGIGGYTTPASVVASLTSDGAGGALLPLGPGQSIDFQGVAPAALHVSNFLVG